MSKPRKKRKSRARNPNGLPKGGYPHPDGGYYIDGKRVKVRRSSRDVVVIATRRKDPDLRQLARVLFEWLPIKSLPKLKNEKTLSLRLLVLV